MSNIDKSRLLKDKEILEALQLAYNRPKLPIEAVSDRDRIVTEAQDALTASIVDKLARQDERTEWIRALLKEGIMVAKPEQLEGIRKRLGQQARQEMVGEITFEEEDVHIFDTSYGYNQVRIDHIFLDENSKLWQELKRGVG